MRDKLFKTLFFGFIFSRFISCSSGNSIGESDRPLRVFAATSLTSVMPAIADAFQEEFEGTEVEFNFAASSILAKQIERGADADIYLSANLQWLQFLMGKKKIQKDSQVNFLGNELVLVTSKNAQRDSTGLEDLLSSDILRIALADWSHVPAGIYAKTALEKAGLWEKIKSKCIPALDVRAALAYVERGDVDYALVYRTDAAISKNVLISGSLPKEIQPDIQYSAATTPNSTHPFSAAFLSFLKSEEAERIFRQNGFMIPEREPDE
ncbi:molybdate ABC transporter substrate-binding protein [candidate division KSB1 bacterium]|nr:molybdate ABC transporter substrate-binding protein [candidate division KSB1 bacterium]